MWLFVGQKDSARVWFGAGWFCAVLSVVLVARDLGALPWLPPDVHWSEWMGVSLGGACLLVAGLRLAQVVGTTIQVVDREIRVTSWYGKTRSIDRKSVLFVDRVFFRLPLFYTHFDFLIPVEERCFRVVSEQGNFYVNLRHSPHTEAEMAPLKAVLQGDSERERRAGVR